jgi:hypothetical protein
MHSALRNHFSVKVRELLDQPDVLEQRRTTTAGSRNIRVVRYRSAGCIGKAIGIRHLHSHFPELCVAKLVD